MSDLSSSEEVFEREKSQYERALRDSGYADVNLIYQVPKPKRKNRSPNITWFNPPFCRSIKSKIGRDFLNIVDQSFPKSHPLSKVLNRITIKVSPSCPSCLPNMQARISSFNKAKLDPTPVNTDPSQAGCKCTQDPCPLRGSCEANDVIYQATITGDTHDFKYVGSTSRKFITRFHTHNTSLRHRHSKTPTSMSRKVWELRDRGIQPTVSYQILKTARSAATCDRKCKLCIEEKKLILFNKDPNLVNSREEIYNRCRNRDRWKIQKFM